MKKLIIAILVIVTTVTVNPKSKFMIAITRHLVGTFLIQSNNAEILEYDINKNIGVFISEYQNQRYKGLTIDIYGGKLYIHIPLREFNWIWRGVDYVSSCKLVTRSDEGSMVFMDGSASIIHAGANVRFQIRSHGDVMFILEIRLEGLY